VEPERAGERVLAEPPVEEQAPVEGQVLVAEPAAERAPVEEQP